MLCLGAQLGAVFSGVLGAVLDVMLGVLLDVALGVVFWCSVYCGWCLLGTVL